MPPNLIYCIGDSHISFFSGNNVTQPEWPLIADDKIPSFVTHRLGAVLAYRLADFQTTTKGKEKLLEIVEKIDPGSTILLCFGEIDCRMHLIKQAEKKNLPLETVVIECAERYFTEITELAKRFTVIVWAIPPSTPWEKIVDPRYPQYGTPEERSRATRLFNEELRRLAKLHNVLFASIFDQLLNKDGTTNTFFYVDSVHLSQRAMPYAWQELKRVLPKENLQFFDQKFLANIPESAQLILIRMWCELSTDLYFIQRKCRYFIKEMASATIGINRARAILKFSRRLF